MNLDNFQKVLDQIEAHPETWEQAVWHTSCGTAHCFAGWAQLLAGDEMSEDAVADDAIRFLDCTEDEADYLFEPERTLADFRHVLQTGTVPGYGWGDES